MNDKLQNYYFDKILIDLKDENVKQIFHTLSDHVARLTHMSAQEIYAHLIKQNKNEGCGIGNGIAIPHLCLSTLTCPFVIFAKTNKPIDFRSNDGELCDLICLIISPGTEKIQHLQSLAKITRSFNDSHFRSALRASKNADDIRFIMHEMSNHKIAA